MKLNVMEYVLRQHQHRLTHPALLLVDDIGKYQIITYKKLYHDVCCLISGLSSLGIAEKSIVCIQADDVYDLILLFLACNGLGWIPCLLLNSLSSEETDYILHDTDAVLFFCLKNFVALPNVPEITRIISKFEYQKLREGAYQSFVANTYFNDPAFLFYTSGSSGHPKGVLHAQHAILAREYNIKSWLTLTADDIVMQTDNLCWTYSMFTGLLDPLLVGATAIIVKESNISSLAETKTKPERWLEIVDYYRVSTLISTPDIFQGIVTSESFKNYHNRYLRQVGAAGSFLMGNTQQLWTNQCHFPIFIALGMTEISTFISTGPKVPYRENKIGKIQPGRKIAILPIDGGIEPIVTPDTPGMLAIHRDELGLMLGYLHDAESERHYRNPWFLTQDIVSYDSHGYIEYQGRADLVIKANSGFRISPVEIEHILSLHPAVIDAACGDRFDQQIAANQIIAYVVVSEVKNNVATSIIQLLKTHLTDYKVPNQIYFVKKLPRSSRNKIIRSELSGLIPISIYPVE